jgi:hypothetical protein
MNAWTETWHFGWIAVIIIAGLLCIWNMILSARLSRLRRALKRIGRAGHLNLEDAIAQLSQRLERLHLESSQSFTRIEQLESRMHDMYSRTGLIRFYAFDEKIGNPSFSLAILNDNRDGIVLTGLNSRDYSYLYAKPVEKGSSSIKLSPEEQEAINQCYEREPQMK